MQSTTDFIVYLLHYKPMTALSLPLSSMKNRSTAHAGAKPFLATVIAGSVKLVAS